ncbi:unnamed protein product [Cuscuta campestris]|uniref:Uncharacterized protein n=1 Tax=Cuscuta campestris TaxID=132261 RepID=A0A484NTS1_9ASTE|nr:unnamed protein product [Cuscuta campestris]
MQILFSSVLLYLIWISPLEKIRKTLLYQRDDILLYGGYGLILVELERYILQRHDRKIGGEVHIPKPFLATILLWTKGR